MLKRVDGAEKRQFGRRATNLRAWVRVSGRPPVPCVLSNLSEGGALVQLETDSWIPFSFRLTTDDKSLDRICEVRHQSGRRVGVEFIAHARDDAPVSAPKRVDDLATWTGEFSRR